MNKKNTGISSATLEGIDLFSGLSPGEREEITHLCRGQNYQPNELILSHKEQSREVFFVVSGSVRVTIYSNSGKEITFRDVPAGKMFGELSAIDDNPRSAHVIALIRSTLVYVDSNDFWNLLNSYPDVAHRTLKYLTSLVRLLSERVVEFSTLGVKNRIHAELLRLGREVEDITDGVKIIPFPTHAQIASRVSTHREAVTREMGALIRKKIIRKERNALIIEDINVLQKMVDDVLSD